MTAAPLHDSTNEAMLLLGFARECLSAPRGCPDSIDAPKAGGGVDTPGLSVLCEETFEGSAQRPRPNSAAGSSSSSRSGSPALIIPGRTYQCRKCLRDYASTDAVRKHAWQKHPDWMRTLGREQGMGASKASGSTTLYCTPIDIRSSSLRDETPQTAHAIMGRTIEVYRAQGGCWQKAKVVAFSPYTEKHTVEFIEDGVADGGAAKGTREQLHLVREQWRQQGRQPSPPRGKRKRAKEDERRVPAGRGRGRSGGSGGGGNLGGSWDAAGTNEVERRVPAGRGGGHSGGGGGGGSSGAPRASSAMSIAPSFAAASSSSQGGSPPPRAAESEHGGLSDEESSSASDAHVHVPASDAQVGEHAETEDAPPPSAVLAIRDPEAHLRNWWWLPAQQARPSSRDTEQTTAGGSGARSSIPSWPAFLRI